MIQPTKKQILDRLALLPEELAKAKEKGGKLSKSLEEYEAAKTPKEQYMVAMFALGRDTAQFVTDHFQSLGYKEMNLAFEKVYSVYLLTKKKRYCGLKLEHPLKKGKIDVKGIDTQRRSTPNVVKRPTKRLLEDLMAVENPTKIRKEIHDFFDDIVQNHIDLKEYAGSSSLKRAYAGTKLEDIDFQDKKLAAIRVQQKTRERAPGTQGMPGDRVSFIITEGKEKTGVSERAEDPAYMAKHPDIHVDRIYYLKRLESLMTGIVDVVPGLDLTQEFDWARRELNHQRLGTRPIDTFFKPIMAIASSSSSSSSSSKRKAEPATKQTKKQKSEANTNTSVFAMFRK